MPIDIKFQNICNFSGTFEKIFFDRLGIAPPLQFLNFTDVVKSIRFSVLEFGQSGKLSRVYDVLGSQYFWYRQLFLSGFDATSGLRR